MKNLADRIDEVYGLIDEGYYLSKIIPRLYPIALECHDYVDYYVLNLLTMPVLNSKEANGAQREVIQSVLRSCGLNQDEIDKIAEQAEEYHLRIRSVDNANNVMVLSVKDMEVKSDSDQEIINELGLRYSNTDSPNERATLLQQIEKSKGYKQQLDWQYEALSTYVNNVLPRLHHKVNMTTSENVDSLAHLNVDPKKVFIIYGHDEAKRRELSFLLKDEFHLDPVILPNKASSSKTIIEKFEDLASTCSFAIALLTPDDTVNENNDSHKQARPNVIFELGWFCGHLGRDHVAILYKATDGNKIFSDLDGVMRIEFHKDVKEAYLDLQTELRAAGLIN